MNHTSFPPPFGTWYSRYAAVYAAPAPEAVPTAVVTELHPLPRLVTAA